jgi:glycosyltransferase involved in cell wall biosynthesis
MYYNPLISIVIPTKNRKKLLHMAVKSVIAQTYKNLQIIVHDNNSTDGTEDYLKNKIDDPRFEFYRSNHDLTMQDNWNAGISYAKGDYICRLDDDNFFLNEFVEVAINEINKRNLDMIFYSALFLLNEKSKFQYSFLPSENIYIINKFQLLYLEFYALTESNLAIYSKKLIDKIITPHEKIYQTTLPDRYLHYKVAENIDKKKLKIGWSSKILGVMRYDYRVNPTRKFDFTYKTCNNISNFISEMTTVHDNFQANRINVINYFFQKCKDIELKKYFYKNIVSKNFFKEYVMAGKQLDIYYLNSFKNLFFFNKFSIIIFFNLLKRPLEIFDEKKAFKMAFIILFRAFKRNIRSILKILLNLKYKEQILNFDYNNKICNLILSGKKIDLFNLKNINCKKEFDEIPKSLNS